MNSIDNQKSPIDKIVTVINNEDIVRMHTLLDLHNNDRRNEYLEIVSNKKFSGKEKFLSVKQLLKETSADARQYLDNGCDGKWLMESLYRRNIFSIFNGISVSELISEIDNKEKVFCEKNISDMFCLDDNDKHRNENFKKRKHRDTFLNNSTYKVAKSQANYHRVSVFNEIVSEIDKCVDGRNEFKWPISVSDTFCFNEPQDNRFSSVLFLLMPKIPVASELSSYYFDLLDVAEHDAIVKLARITGLNVILIDIDSAVDSVVCYEYEDVINSIAEKIINNNNSIIFFKKRSIFVNNNESWIIEEASKRVGDYCSKIEGIEYNYILMSNFDFSFSGLFRKTYLSGFFSNERKWNGILQSDGDGRGDNDFRDKELMLKETLSQSIRNPEEITETIDGIIGIKEARDVIGDIITFYKKPEMAKKLGVNLSSGILLTGEPGTGKTVVARAMAKELNRKVIMTTGSDFTTHNYGDAITKVKMLFELAREIAPCIVFIDEIDGIGNRDNSRMHPEERRVINKFLSEMSEKTRNEGIVFIGATNNPKEIDKALLRDGRFDKKVVVNKPSMEDRKEAFIKFLGKRPTDDLEKMDFEYLAMKTSGMTVATIENIVNQSAIIALRKESEFITEGMIEQAILDNIAGGEMSKKPMKPELIKRIAYHEAGHAVIGYHLDVGEIGGVSIVPRADALGMVFFDTDDDRLALSTESELSAQMMVALAGRASEEVFLGSVSTGSSGDLEACTKIAVSMIQNYGMGDSMVYSYKKGGVNEDIPDEIRSKVDKLIREKYKEVLNIIKKNKPAVEAVAKELIARDVISGKEFIRIIKGE